MRCESLVRYGFEGAVEVVDGFDQVFCEPLDGELTGGFDVAFGAFLKVAEVGDGAEVPVLKCRSIN